MSEEASPERVEQSGADEVTPQQGEEASPPPASSAERDSPSRRMPSDAEDSDDESKHPPPQVETAPAPAQKSRTPENAEPAQSKEAAPAAASAPAQAEPQRSYSAQDQSDYSEDDHQNAAAQRQNATSRSTTDDRHDDDDDNDNSRREQTNNSRQGATSLPPIDGKKQHSQPRSTVRGHHTPIAAIRYPARQDGLTVADFLDASKPLVKSSVPLTRPKGPSFVEDNYVEHRKSKLAEQKMQSAMHTAQINSQRVNERKYLKAQYEFEREKQLAERAIYHKERVTQWANRFGANPLAVDLVADNERIEEEAYVREMEDRRRKTIAERKKQKIKRAIIVKALAEVPLLEEARRQKRELVEEEKRDKALRDVQRVEAIQEKKLKDQELLSKERQAKLDQRIMTSSGSK